VTPEDAQSRVESFLRTHPLPLALVPDADGKGALLLEPGSGKSLHVLWDRVAEVVVRTSQQRPAPYLVLVFEDGRQLALADVGFAFVPSTASTGPLTGLPATFCFRDFWHLLSGAEALLEHEDEERDALSAVMLAIALLDGARTAGFDVSREERTLESVLKRLEERGARP
jgi:hypothetical protein